MTYDLALQALFATMQGFRPLQRQELDPDSRIRVWVSYGDPVFCYWRQYHFEQLRYTYGTSWKLLLTLENWGVDHTYTEYPHRFRQRISTFTPSFGAEVPLGCLTMGVSLGYAYDYGTYKDVTEWQLAGPLLQQWDYWDGDGILGSIDLRWQAASGRTYVRAHYDAEVSLASDADGMRHVAALSIGFVF